MYTLTRFAGVTMPPNMPVTQMPTVGGQDGTVRTLAGNLDAWGDDVAPPQFPVRVQFRALVTNADVAVMQAKVDELRALGRRRSLLYRTQDEINIQYAVARLQQADMTSTPHTRKAQEMALTFDVWGHWRHNLNEDWTLDDGSLLDSGLLFDVSAAPVTLTTSPQTVSVINGGNVAVDDAVVTVTAGSAAITALTIACGRAKWSWTGTLAAGDALVVDTGAWSVKNDGADAYAGFALDATHTLAGLLRLEPGANSITVTRTGGGTGSTFDITFAEAWA